MGPFIFPDIDPVAFALGPLVVRWYALAFIAGLILAWRHCIWLAGREPRLLTPRDADDFLLWATLGVILGGRLGYVILYQPGYYLSHLPAVLQIWAGGMSFHGGFLGAVVAMLLFERKRGLRTFALTDIVAAAAPMGLLLGRIANFINGELWGRVTDVPWAVIFPRAGPEPRHPSQLYEAALEGFLLAVVLNVLVLAFGARRWPGLASGVFLLGYGLARMAVETMREPDRHLGLLQFGTTWGQWLSLPMLVVGIWLIWRALKHRPAEAT